jgi:hypothetical protein
MARKETVACKFCLVMLGDVLFRLRHVLVGQTKIDQNNRRAIESFSVCTFNQDVLHLDVVVGVTTLMQLLKSVNERNAYLD